MLGLEPIQLKDDIATAESIVQRLPSEAPDEIKDGARRLAEINQAFYDAIKAADYVMLDADFSFMDDATLQADVEAALAELDVYTQRECGRVFDQSGE